MTYQNRKLKKDEQIKFACTYEFKNEFREVAEAFGFEPQPFLRMLAETAVSIRTRESANDFLPKRKEDFISRNSIQRAIGPNTRLRLAA